MEHKFYPGNSYEFESNKLYPDLKDEDVITKIAFLKVSGEEKTLEIGDLDLTQEHLDLSNEFSKYWTKFEKIESMYMLVLGDIADFKSYKKIAEKNIEVSRDAKKCSNKFNRLLVHVLSSGKIFVDFMENYLEKEYGVNSDQYKEFKETLSKEYDNCFEYRFMYSLRNYTQHIEMPLSSVKIGVTNNLSDNDINIKLLISTNHLLSSGFDWKPIIVSDFKSISDDINISSVVEKYFYSIIRIYRKINEIFLKSNYSSLMQLKSNFEKISQSYYQVFRYKITKYNLKHNPTSFHLEPIVGLNEIDRIFLKLGEVGLVNIQED